MVPPITKFLRVGLLVACATSIGVVVLHFTAARGGGGDDVFAATSLIISKFGIKKYPQNQNLADMSPQQRVIASHAGSQSSTPETVNSSVDCTQSSGDGKAACEVVHIAITSWGTNVTRDTSLLLKSIFLYRKGPLHLHILADQIATVILSVLLRSWRLFGVSYAFYDLDKLKEKYAVEGSSTSEDTRLLVQLALPDILPVEVDRILVLNSDRVVAVDVRELWSLFSCFHQSQSFGAVLWPRNKTVGAGLLLLDVEKLRVGGWSMKVQVLQHNLSALVTEGSMKNFEQMALAGLYQYFHYLVYNLPCQYNYPTAITSQDCPVDVKQVKVFEFNSDRVPTLFWKAFLKVARYDGSLLRTPTAYTCGTTDDNEQDDEISRAKQIKLVDTIGNNVCKDYVRELIGTFRTHFFYLGSNYDVEDFNDVTLATQLNIGRINTLEKLCVKWRGPMSVAVYLADSDAMHFVSYVKNSKVLSSRKNIVFHLLYEDGSLYPTNHLRNAAVAQVKTSYVFVLDVDFMPCPSLYEDLRQAIQVKRLATDKIVLLVPAFETDDYSIVFPETKEKLLPMLDTGVAYPFRNKTYARGHFATNYTAWRTATEPYKIEWEEGFEPYFAMRTEQVPKYRENFMGYGMDKIVHIMEVTAQGYSFLVMPNAYLLHLPHAETFDRTRHSGSLDIMTCMKMLEEDVARELLRKHGNNSLNGWNPDSTTTPSPMRPQRKPIVKQFTPTKRSFFSQAVAV